jgi:adenosylhomocysteine nucleosidase
MSAAETVRRVAILAPMRSELRPIRRSLALRRSLSLSADRSDGGSFFRGSQAGVEIVATVTGIGMGPAARTTERILDLTAVDHLIVAGIAGGIGSGVRIGDLIVPEKVLDLASGAHYRPTLLGSSTPYGTLVTSNELINNQEVLASLARQGVVAVDMETAAIAAVCETRGCPWSVFRAISDRAGDGTIDTEVGGLVGPDGRPRLLALLRTLLRKPRSIPQLVHLARGAQLATAVAAWATLKALEEL